MHLSSLPYPVLIGAKVAILEAEVSVFFLLCYMAFTNFVPTFLDAQISDFNAHFNEVDILYTQKRPNQLSAYISWLNVFGGSMP